MRVFPIILICILLFGCGKENKFLPDPGKSILLFPANNSICISGTVLSDTQSNVDFKWDKTENTETYELVIKNLLTDVVVNETLLATEKSVSLLRNTPYSWFVISKSKDNIKTTKSETFKFYNAGLGNLFYAPFPAEVLLPTMNQIINTTTINLEWKGSSIDKNIVSYDVYIGTNQNPPLFKSNVTESKLNGVSIIPRSQYYWKIISKDSNSNTSESEIFKFRTQ